MTHKRRSLPPSPSVGRGVGRMDLIKLPALGIWEGSQWGAGEESVEELSIH